MPKLLVLGRDTILLATRWGLPVPCHACGDNITSGDEYLRTTSPHPFPRPFHGWEMKYYHLEHFN